jgi:Ca2+-binding EF-hand superfamily protein
VWRVILCCFCAEDGVIDANDLRAKLGNEANVAEIIRQADHNKDGKIDRNEFCEMLKSM